MKKYWLTGVVVSSLLVLGACAEEEAPDNEPPEEDEGSAAAEENVDGLENPTLDGVEPGETVTVAGQIIYAEGGTAPGELYEDTQYTIITDSSAEIAYDVTHSADETLYVGDDVEITGEYAGYDNGMDAYTIDGSKAVVTNHNDGVVTIYDEDGLNEMYSANEEISDDSDGEERLRDEMDENGEFNDPDFGKGKAYGLGIDASIDEEDLKGVASDEVTDIAYRDYDIGPMNIKFLSSIVIDVEPIEEVKSLLDDKDRARLLMIEMEVTNTSDEDVSFYPDQSVLTTNTGQQVDSDIWLSDSVGGDFYGEVTKEGQIMFILEDDGDELEDFTLILDAPHGTESYDSVGEDKRIDFNILDWETMMTY